MSNTISRPVSGTISGFWTMQMIDFILDNDLGEITITKKCKQDGISYYQGTISFKPENVMHVVQDGIITKILNGGV